MLRVWIKADPYALALVLILLIPAFSGAKTVEFSEVTA